MPVKFINREEALSVFDGKRVAIVGSGPGILQNQAGLVDSYDIIVRINNYKLLNESTGKRTDVFYSYFGGAIRKTPQQLKDDGVFLCMTKCPNSKPIRSQWHEDNRKTNGIDFRPIYRRRKDFWFCDTYIAGDKIFLDSFNKLERHVPTTGFQAIWEIKDSKAKEIYITGFDFFRSGRHNVNERWKEGDREDPIRHEPEKEKALLLTVIDDRFKFDRMAREALNV